MEKSIVDYIREEVDMNEVYLALKCMEKNRCPLELACGGLYDQIYDLLEEYGQDNDLPEGWWESEFEIEDVLFELV